MTDRDQQPGSPWELDEPWHPSVATARARAQLRELRATLADHRPDLGKPIISEVLELERQKSA